MRFLAIGDIEKPDDLLGLLKLDLESYSFMLIAGDISGISEGWKIGFARINNDASFLPAGKDPKSYYEEVLSNCTNKLRKIDDNLKEIKDRLKIYAVYGNADHKSVIERVKPKTFVLLHANVVKEGDMLLTGYNGHPAYPWELNEPDKRDIFGHTNREVVEQIHSFTEDKIYADLTATCRDLPKDKLVLLTHTPPYGILDRVRPEFIKSAIASYGESARNGDIGSTGLRRFIDEQQPLISVFGHVHESKGVKKLGRTTCINAGAFGKEVVEVEINQARVNASFSRIEKVF